MLMNAKKPVQHVNTIVQTHLEVISVLVTATDLHSIKIDFVQASRSFFRLSKYGGNNAKIIPVQRFSKVR